MVNGNYVLYGDRPSSESEIVDDHVQTRTAERKNKRKPTRTANELQRTLNMAQLDNETDSIKYEKKAKEPRLLRYVPTTDVEENFVTEKFETYDLKPTEERPRRYAFQKKPKNPTDGSVNYAYSRSSSSCSSPNGNLPTISEHGEQYSTYRAQPLPSPRDADIVHPYEHKLDKYFYKQKDAKKFPSKVNYEGSHPDSLYRVSADGVTSDKMVRLLRVLRWPVALVVVCIALAVFVYFLMPDNIDSGDATNQTLWDPVAAGAHYKTQGTPLHRQHLLDKTAPKINDGTKTPEIDFYDAESDKNSEYVPVTDNNEIRVQPIQPVFPSHITLEVQYGNEKADVDKLRTPKVLDASTPSADSTVKPHITLKPEKPLAVYFKDLNEATTIAAETISRAETVNEFGNYGEKQTTKKVELSTKSRPTAYKDYRATNLKPVNVKQYLVTEPEIPPEVQEFYGPSAPANVEANFTSGHSMLFGISIEDAEKLKSTTQSSIYNTRVSPTLPTWRDGDDATTKHYPPVNYTADEAPLCRSTRYALCRGVLPYDLAGFPVKVDGLDFAAFMPHIQYLVGSNCSQRSRQFLCALLEPECHPYPHQTKMPCYDLCRSIVDSCEGSISKSLMSAFNCKRYSETDCIAARAPCYDREMTCGDGTCIPREWVCDNRRDCPGGEDEAACSSCAKNEYRCSSGGCILNRWLCDGYADCPGGEDEVEACDHHAAGEPGEESAGSAPAPAVRRPNRLPARPRDGDFGKTGESDNSKELLVTSDSNNGFKRNFTRRPSLSRLSPYTRSTTPPPRDTPPMRDYRPYPVKETEPKDTTQKPETNDSTEDINIGDLGIFDEIKKTANEKTNEEPQKPSGPKATKTKAVKPAVVPTTLRTTRLDKTINKFEKVIDGVGLMQKQIMEDQEVPADSPESNATTEREEFPIAQRPGAGSISSHVSPCPTGELRCVDGRCITLAQLCDGTIDCTDHADEDNCFT